MTSICDRPPQVSLVKRLGRALGLALLLSLPCFLVNLAVQGCREFRQEIETSRKYRTILKNQKSRKDR